MDTYYAGKASKYASGFYFQDWGNETFIQGVYSYAKPKLGKNRLEAQVPIKQQIFFAGEAYCNNGNNGTVHGALETSEMAVKQMLWSGLDRWRS